MGGGTDVTSSYASYLQDIHSALMTGTDPSVSITDFAAYGNISDAFVAAVASGSPYAAVEAYDPETDIDTIQARIDEHLTAVDAIDPDALVQGWATAAATAADSAVTSAEIDAAVDAFEARSQGAYLRNVSRFAAGMFDIGAVMTTQFGMGLAQMELDRQEQVNDMDARLRLVAERERYQAVMQYSSEMARMFALQLQELRAGAGTQFDASRFAIQAYQDQIGLDLSYEVNDATWDLELFQYPMGNIGVLSGAVQMHKPQTKGERLAASVMTAGSFGLQVGTAMGSPQAGVLAGGISLATQLLAGVA